MSATDAMFTTTEDIDDFIDNAPFLKQLVRSSVSDARDAAESYGLTWWFVMECLSAAPYDAKEFVQDVHVHIIKIMTQLIRVCDSFDAIRDAKEDDDKMSHISRTTTAIAEFRYMHHELNMIIHKKVRRGAVWISGLKCAFDLTEYKLRDFQKWASIGMDGMIHNLMN